MRPLCSPSPPLSKDRGTTVGVSRSPVRNVLNSALAKSAGVVNPSIFEPHNTPQEAGRMAK